MQLPSKPQTVFHSFYPTRTGSMITSAIRKIKRHETQRTREYLIDKRKKKWWHLSLWFPPIQYKPQPWDTLLAIGFRSKNEKKGIVQNHDKWIYNRQNPKTPMLSAMLFISSIEWKQQNKKENKALCSESKLYVKVREHQQKPTMPWTIFSASLAPHKPPKLDTN